MFNSSKIRTWLGCAAMVLYLLTNMSPAGSGLVLCIGQNGHVAIEVATVEAECSDCVPTETLVESCCTAPADREQGLAACTCSDIPIPSSSKVETTAPSQQGTAAVSPPCMLARADLLVPPPHPRSLDLRSHAQSPPCPRVPALLTLRI